MPETTRRKSASTRKEKRSKKRPSKRSHKAMHVSRIVNHASESMSMFDLQKMAKSKGIPFGGLRKSQLVRKINIY